MSNMNDVSHLAGVSRGTVSNYINGLRVRPAAQKQIEKAIKELNYVPNAAARTLKTNRSNYVVLIIPMVNTPFFSELSYCMQLILKKSGYKMILCNSNNCPQEEIEYIQMAKKQKVAGIITMSYADIREIVPPDIPLVALENKVADFFPLIVSDNYQGGELAAAKLHVLGAGRLLFISKAPVKNVSLDREKGFKDYCNRNGVEYTRFVAKDKGNFTDDFQDFIKKNLVNKKFKYDGVFSDSDEYASDFWYLLLKQKIAVPEEVQIIGFDAAKIYPRQKIALSSIRQPITEIAKQAVLGLEKQLNNNSQKKLCQPLVLPVSFMQGQTTK
ncbi:transcriptional regulator [Liquorilactobacillus uvarum DSM 19971]|uniref:Transcriptional regulator n=2 Tax=Liquorilactobacillus uvarum TaxID=303240 RepID=A0A0R1Q0A7_9LACO|nr:transcriptional regulator [Liquorilactobacillus uvarum DSM 19971]